MHYDEGMAAAGDYLTSDNLPRTYTNLMLACRLWRAAAPPPPAIPALRASRTASAFAADVLATALRDEHLDVVQRILNLSSSRRVRKVPPEDTDDTIRAEPTMDARDVSQACRCQRTHRWFVMIEKAQARILRPSPIVVEVRNRDERARDTIKVAGRQSFFSLLSTERLYFFIDH